MDKSTATILKVLLNDSKMFFSIYSKFTESEETKQICAESIERRDYLIKQIEKGEKNG